MLVVWILNLCYNNKINNNLIKVMIIVYVLFVWLFIKNVNSAFSMGKKIIMFKRCVCKNCIFYFLKKVINVNKIKILVIMKRSMEVKFLFWLILNICFIIKMFFFIVFIIVLMIFNFMIWCKNEVMALKIFVIFW